MPLQLPQQFHDLALDGAVERRGRFVEQDQCRFQHQCPGDGDALALAAGEFVGVTVAGLRIEPDLHQRVDDRLLLFGLAADPMDAQAFADDLADTHAWAEAAIRVLEHHLHLAAQRAHVMLRETVQPGAFEADAALAFQQPQDRQAKGRLARAAFANDAQRLPAG